MELEYQSRSNLDSFHKQLNLITLDTYLDLENFGDCYKELGFSLGSFGHMLHESRPHFGGTFSFYHLFMWETTNFHSHTLNLDNISFHFFM
jgi:hypothetical protein